MRWVRRAEDYEDDLVCDCGNTMFTLYQTGEGDIKVYCSKCDEDEDVNLIVQS